MRHRPLNRDTAFELWPPFDPGYYIDFNPSFVRLTPERAFAVIRRDRVPPVPGKGTVWAVAVDDAMRPAGRPFPIVAEGEDPRAVLVGGRVLVFYVLFERDAEDRITGTSIVLAEFEPADGSWPARAHFKLPKVPLGRPPAGSDPGWEKNWVPFGVSDRQVGLIYSHDPWQVIVLNVDTSTTERRFEHAYRADGLRWHHGEVRGGTPPVRHGPGELITFFHSSAVVGSRKNYMVGACVFADAPPYRPLRMTAEPLLAAPYKGGMHRHGWRVASSVIFPLGCEAVEGGYRLLCGIDDGEIGSFVVPTAALQERLQPLPFAPPPMLQHAGGAVAADVPLLLQPPGTPAPDWPLLRFLAQAADCGRTLLDVGGDAGLYMVGLAAGYRHVEAVATSAEAARWRARNAALGGLAALTVHLPKGMTGALAEAAGAVARAPWPLTALDEAGFAEVDLLLVDAPEPAAVVRGLARTIARDRPLLLLFAEVAERGALAEVLAGLGYGLEAIFPRSPRALLCRHPSHRAAMAWYL
jgi:predicted GH43/DUF377 family glycosyl hydrolase